MQERTIQDYCRAIDKLDSGEGAKSTEIAKELHLSRNTIAMTLQKLSEGGFVSMKRYGKATLSKKGREIARKIRFKHRIIETFLVEKLGMPANKVHDEACAMEHWASDDMIDRLYKYIGKPTVDPHGRKITKGTIE